MTTLEPGNHNSVDEVFYTAKDMTMLFTGLIWESGTTSQMKSQTQNQKPESRGRISGGLHGLQRKAYALIGQYHFGRRLSK